ncbi:MAG: viologen exporter family transport system ATP-binding protein [Acidimicrobiaceae bacterium]|jgi:ABC-2 type transport system ATP-binding protein|nr:viologen exporter family transport system ATP-binding protein [Acidimicrobiaceae bacterium]
MAQIELVDVVKEYSVWHRAGRVRRQRKLVRAVDRISLSVAEGELCGYIGPNGAGKSTTVKMLTGIIMPTSGRIRVAGKDPQRQRIELARRIGVVFGQRTQLWWDLPLADSFDLLRHVYRVPHDRHRANVNAFIDLLDLGPFMQTPVRQLSLGQRMRGDLTAALLHDPEILYLDEPTIGLDVVSKARVREFLASVNRDRGVTVLLTTHDLTDVERLCTRLVVIDHGRLIHDGTVAEIKSRFGDHRTVVVDLEEAGPPLEVASAEVVGVDGPRQWLRFDRQATTAAAVVAAVAEQAALRDIAIEEPDIEGVVRRIYSGDAASTPDLRDDPSCA